MLYLIPFFILLNVPTGILAYKQKHICGPNEHFNKCAPSCSLGCPTKFLDHTSRKCESCVARCECNENYVNISNEISGSKHLCILKEYCPGIGDRKAIFSKCKAECQPTCEKRKRCSKQKNCVPGYVCKKGFLRNDKGYCVHPNQC